MTDLNLVVAQSNLCVLAAPRAGVLLGYSFGAKLSSEFGFELSKLLNLFRCSHFLPLFSTWLRALAAAVF